jgi:hypothetical protein
MALRRSLYAWPDEPLGQLHKGVEQIDEEPTRVPLWPLATFAKPSTNFTNSLPSFFAFVSGLWLKTDAGPRDGEIKNSEASNGATYPDVALYSVLKVTAGLKISSSAQVQQSRPGQD